MQVDCWQITIMHQIPTTQTIVKLQGVRVFYTAVFSQRCMAYMHSQKTGLDTRHIHRRQCLDKTSLTVQCSNFTMCYPKATPSIQMLLDHPIVGCSLSSSHCTSSAHDVDDRECTLSNYHPAHLNLPASYHSSLSKMLHTPTHTS